MNAPVSSAQRFTSSQPCPICGGHDRHPRDQGKRCFGFLSGDSRYAHCTREELAGDILIHPDAGTYPHRLDGPCACGVTHGVVSDENIRRWQICDAGGRLVAIHARKDVLGADKLMWWELADGTVSHGQVKTKTLPLYSSERVRDWDRSELVLVVEGEKDCDALLSRGFHALGTVTGAPNCHHAAAFEVVHGFNVCVWPDADEKGATQMAAAARHLTGKAARVDVFVWKDAPVGGGAHDYFASGGTADALRIALATAANAAEWLPKPVEKPSPWAASPLGGGTAELISFDGLEPEAVAWLWEWRVPIGMVTLLEGNPDVGKSYLTVDIAARITTGAPMPDGSSGGAPANVIFAATEDHIQAVLLPRLILAGADRSRVHLVAIRQPDGSQRDAEITPADLLAVELACVGRNIGLVVFDPLFAALPDHVKVNTDHQVRRALLPLKGLAERLRCAVLALRHWTKSERVNVLHKGGGSVGITAAARSQLVVGLDQDDETRQRRVLALPKHNLAPADTPSLAFTLAPTRGPWDSEPDRPPAHCRVAWQGEIQVTADDLAREPEAATETTKDALAAAREFLLESLAGGAEVSSKELIAQAPCSRRTLFTVKARLGVKAVKRGSLWVWRIPSKESYNSLHPSLTLSDNERWEGCKGAKGAPIGDGVARFALFDSPMAEAMVPEAEARPDDPCKTCGGRLKPFGVSGDHICTDCKRRAFTGGGAAVAFKADL